MNAGIYHLSRDVLKDLPDKGDIEKTVFPNYAKSGKLQIVKFQNVKWHSIDSFKDRCMYVFNTTRKSTYSMQICEFIEECILEIDKIIK